MRHIFQPGLHIDNVHQIDVDNLCERGVKAIFFDIDNTLAPYSAAEPPDEICALVDKFIRRGIAVCLLSNNNERRVTAFSKNLNVMAVHSACKPLGFKLKRALRMMRVQQNAAAIAGDQIFTDIWVGNRLGLFTILVEPIEKSREGFFAAVKRRLERLVYNKA